MNVTCPNCATIYRVDPRKVPPEGVRARCAVCSAIFGVSAEADRVVPADETPARAPAPPAPASDEAATAPETPEPPRAVVAPEPPPATPPVESRTPPPEPPRAPPAPPVAPPAARPAPPVSGAPSRSFAAPPAMPRPAGLPSRPAAPSGAPPVTRQAPESRRQINPFLSQDPSQKARRLARALISDMVVYHPAKRREGLRDGTLKTLFDEEIKKSWEEYLEQVGRDIAESTDHFTEALNEILADGRQIF